MRSSPVHSSLVELHSGLNNHLSLWAVCCVVRWADLYMVWLGISPFVVVHDLQLVKEVLHSPTSAKNYEKGMFAEIMRPLLGQGLLLSEGTPAQDQKSQLWGEGSLFVLFSVNLIRHRRYLAGAPPTGGPSLPALALPERFAGWVLSSHSSGHLSRSRKVSPNTRLCAQG